MKLRNIFYIEGELTQGKKEGVLPIDIRNLLDEAVSSGKKVIVFENDSIQSSMEQAAALPEESLIITTRKGTLEQIAHMPLVSVGYADNYFGEDLYQADLLAEGFDEVDVEYLEHIFQRKHGIPWRIIETERCYLREMSLGDMDDLYEMYAGAGMTEYMEPLYEREEEEIYTRAYIENMYGFYGFGMWLVKDKKTDALIGRAGLNVIEQEGKTVLEMGYAIAVPYQRRGYAKEVCRGIMEYTKTLHYDRLCCFIHPQNEASKGLLYHLGFTGRGYANRDGMEMLLYEWRMGRE